MRVLNRHIYISLGIGLSLLLASCVNNRYKPVSDSHSDLLKGGTAVDTLFVDAMSAATAEEFDSAAINFLEAYARDFDDTGIRQFSPNTPYSSRQDSLLFYMEDYLLNTFRYEESIQLGSLLDSRLKGSQGNTALHSAALGDIAVAYFYLGNLEEAIKYQRRTRAEEVQSAVSAAMLHGGIVAVPPGRHQTYREARLARPLAIHEG